MTKNIGQLPNKFEEIPGFVDKSLDAYQNVVLFFCDALGWKFFKKGKKILSQFPSTTMVHVSTILSGLALSEHAMPEWEYYDKDVDDLIKPLFFSYAKDRIRDTLTIEPNKIFKEGHWVERMIQDGITPWLIENKEYCFGNYTNIVGKSFNKIPIENNLRTGLKQINKILRNNRDNKNYIYFYYDKFDNKLHRYGCKSKIVKNELEKIKRNLKWFEKQKGDYRKNTLFIVVADHGHIDVDKNKTFYINKEIPEINEMIRENKNGKKIYIGGSCRCAFLYIKPEYVEKAFILLKEKLKKIALVDKSEKIIKLNCHKERIGNIVIRPLSNNSVWWYKKGIYELRHKSYHGGMSKDEMEIPFLTQELK
jgi:predicted AlkP superfamily pyrophosphatase or phosphodiesterase